MNDLHVSNPTTKDRIKKVEEQFHVWKVVDGKAPAVKSRPGTRFLTISREYGCAGFRIGDSLSAALDAALSPAEPHWTVYDRKLVDKICESQHLNRALVESLDNQRKHLFSDYITGLFTGEPSSIQVFKKCAEVIYQLASHGRVILIGRASALIAGKITGGFHLRIVAPLDWRVKQVAAYEKIESLAEARKHVEQNDNERGKYARDFLGKNLKDPAHYDLVLNQQTLGVAAIVKIVLEAMEVKGLE